MSHTPGPWKAEDIGAGTCAWGVVADGGRVVVEHDFVSGPDARLIAAAPTMYDALKRIAYEPFGVADATHEQVLDAITTLALEMVAKAEGA